jgi:multidrug efflux pump subunit AcrA (membrane-fusion protein)
MCYILFAVLFLALFLPWTQNIRSNGKLTTYLPQDRPQSIQSVIPGRIEQWYVREGQSVRQGDTIVRISEIKEKYMDPGMLDRLAEQIEAKEGSQSATTEKVTALANQIRALQKERSLSLEKARNKVRQAELKVVSDSADLTAARTEREIAQLQAQRADSLLSKGLISLNEQERRKLRTRESSAKLTAVENKLLTSRNELLNANIELSSLDAEYGTKISKAESELNTAISYMYETQSEIAKMNIEYSGLSIRSGYYYVTAPRDGQIVQARAAGIGMNVSEGDVICTLLPVDPHLAVELYVEAMDVPLLEKGRKVRLQFDGWPALVFSGWPGYSFGTFGGTITAIDNFTSQGKYRILVVPDTSDVPWPTRLLVGSGTYGWVMLKDVPIWYELWRQFNGFPPDYMGTRTDVRIPESDKKKEKDAQ